MTIIYSIIVFLLVILVHEFGHFFVAKLCNMKVNEFSIGMGPLVASKKGIETQYSLRAIPFGGYVALEGEEEESTDPRSFKNASPIKRIAVLIAGAGMNFLLAILAFVLVFSVVGMPSTTIETVIDNSPAYIAGLLSGDEIISIEGNKIKEWQDIINQINKSEDEIIEVVILRNSQEVNLSIKTIEENGAKKIGIIPKNLKNIDSSLSYAVKNTIGVIVDVYKFIGKLITGKVDISSVSGPVGVIRFIGESSKSGIINVIFVMGAISANLGAFNILPIPALDGGKILLTIFELVTGKKVPEKFEEYLTIAGFVLLISLMIYVTIFNDIL